MIVVLVWDGEGCQVVTASSKKEGDSYCMMVKNGCKVHQQEGSREGDSHCKYCVIVTQPPELGTGCIQNRYLHPHLLGCRSGP